VSPAVRSVVDVGDVHGPTLVASLSLAPELADPGPRSMPPLVAEPARHLEDAVDGLAVDQEPVAEAQDGPEPAVAEGGVLADELLDPLGEDVIADRLPLRGSDFIRSMEQLGLQPEAQIAASSWATGGSVAGE